MFQIPTNVGFTEERGRRRRKAQGLSLSDHVLPSPIIRMFDN